MNCFLGITSHAPKWPFQAIVSGLVSCSGEDLWYMIFACDNQRENSTGLEIHWIHNPYQNNRVNVWKRHVSLKQHFFYSSFRFFFVQSHRAEQRSRITSFSCQFKQMTRVLERAVGFVLPGPQRSFTTSSVELCESTLYIEQTLCSEANRRGHLHFVHLEAVWLTRLHSMVVKCKMTGRNR